MTIRVHELAKELNASSKDVIAQLSKLKVAVKGPMSTVEDAVVEKLRRALGAAKSGAKSARPSAKKAAATAVATAKAPAKTAKPAVVKKAPANVVAPPTPSVTTPAPPPSKPATVVAAPAAPVAKPAPAPVKPALPAAKPLLAPTPTPVPTPTKIEPAAPPPAPAVAVPLKMLKLQFPITVKDLSTRLELKPNELIKHLMSKKIFAGLTQLLDQAAAAQAAKDFGYELAPQPSLEEQAFEQAKPDPAKLAPRAPVVTFMGHVDHGKTSLLDAIRKSKVAEGEAGGITQHIGAYEVLLPSGRVTFLDTPGHEAFTALRARGANVTDVVVLVVAADDGVMPQTLEAIDHAKAAGVPIVVAVNKMDKPGATPDKIKQQLAERELIAEDWGGKTIMVPVSAKTGEGIDRLLEMLLLEAELLELKADPTTAAQGAVIEARLSKDRGPIATLLVQHGTLRVGDLVVVGTLAGRVRALTNDRGHRVKDAQPSSPVEVLGLPGVPKAGDQFLVIADEKITRQIVEQRQDRAAERAVVPVKRITLEDLHQRIIEGKLKELKLILKADVQGSLEAIVQSLAKINTAEVKLQTIHGGVGDISESDVMLAAASDAIVIGFHVGVEPQVQVEAVREGVDIRIYSIIYELVNAIRAAIEGLLEPEIEQVFLGRAEVRRLFQISKIGVVAGCMVTKGMMRRDAVIRVVRGKERVLETKVSSLKRIKDDVRDVQEGNECGIALEGNLDLQPGDLIEAWEFKKVARKLA